MVGNSDEPADTLGIRGEAATLTEFLQYMRDGVIRKAAVPDAIATRPGVPSGTSLAWLVRHPTVSERFWFCAVPVDDWDLASEPPPESTIVELVEDYRAAGQEADTVIAEWASDLDRVIETEEDGRPRCTVRWIVQHMITETGRHAGHADILREQIDGDVGR